MDAIKKKMQAMKGEKENAVERATEAEEQAKEANAKAEKVSQECSFRNAGSLCSTPLLISYTSSLDHLSNANRRKKRFEHCRRRSNRSKMSWIRCKRI